MCRLNRLVVYGSPFICEVLCQDVGLNVLLRCSPSFQKAFRQIDAETCTMLCIGVVTREGLCEGSLSCLKLETLRESSQRALENTVDTKGPVLKVQRPKEPGMFRNIPLALRQKPPNTNDGTLAGGQVGEVENWGQKGSRMPFLKMLTVSIWVNRVIEEGKVLE